MAEIAWRLPGGAVSVLVVDATPRETHVTTGTVSKHPIGRTTPATDHYSNEHDRLTLDVFFSNHPTRVPRSNMDGVQGSVRSVDFIFSDGTEARATVLAFDDEFDHVRSAYEELLALKRSATLLEVFTSLREYQNMLIVSMSVLREASTGDALVATVELEETRIVESRVVDDPDAERPRGRRGQDRGRENPEDNDEDTDGRSRSLLSGIFNAVLGSGGSPPPNELPPPPPPA